MLQVGEEKKLQVKFPDDYPVELWQGMDAEATVKVGVGAGRGREGLWR